VRENERNGLIEECMTEGFTYLTRLAVNALYSILRQALARPFAALCLERVRRCRDG
jgi:hypothetical protein